MGKIQDTAVKGQASLVFGLQWFALIQGPRSSALSLLLQRRRPKYLCFSGHTFYSVGLYQHVLPKRTQVYSAALCLALRYTEASTLFLLPTASEQWWVLALHEGTVVSGTDCLYACRSEALAHIERLQLAYPMAQCIEQVPGQQSLEQWVLPMVQAAACLQPYRRRPYRAAAFSLCLAALVIGFWSSTESVAPPSSGVQAVQVQQVWKDFEQKHALHGVAGLRSLLHLLEGLPLQPGGWTLQQAHCEPHAQRWSCAVQYARSGATANNQSLENATPPGVVLRFDSLNAATLLWSTELHSQVLDAGLLHRRRRNERDLFTQLQRVQAAFSRLSVSPAQTVAPNLPPGMSAMPDAPAYLARRWHSQGPMRSHYVLLPWVGAFRWEQAALKWRPDVVPNLHSSALTLSLEGSLYELADETVHSPQSHFSYLRGIHEAALGDIAAQG